MHLAGQQTTMTTTQATNSLSHRRHRRTNLLLAWLFIMTLFTKLSGWFSLSQSFDQTTTTNNNNNNNDHKQDDHPQQVDETCQQQQQQQHPMAFQDLFLNKTPWRGGHCPPDAAAGSGSGDDENDFIYDAAAHAMGGKSATSSSSTTSSSSSSSSSTTTSLLLGMATDDDHPLRPVVVHIPNYGRVQGKRDGGIDFFGGIPYASPPVGSLRFAPPEPPPPWAPAKLDATHFGPDCWQMADPILNPNVDPHQMSEDCLYLNIFTPAGHSNAAAAAAASAAAASNVRLRNPILSVGWGAATSSNNKNNNQQSSKSSTSSSKLLPVMVWFHGGAFQMGGARRPEYDGRRLAERNMVVVTFNYRLGALGFLVSSPDGLWGNFGLMDQRAVLHWIHDNIRAFGGDPNNVTLFGESAGAVMIGLHLMMMEKSGNRGTARQLFHKAILQSNPLGYTFRSVVVDDFIGEALKRSIDCRDVACLRSERVEEIMRAQSNLMGVPRSVGDFFTWGPTLTQDSKITLTSQLKKQSSLVLRQEHRLFRNLDLFTSSSSDSGDASSSSSSHRGGRGSTMSGWAAVNVSQPLKNLHLIPDEIPILIGSNKHEGEIFIHSVFPITMSKPVYWMFVGALFRDSASRVLKHYRGYVDQIEQEAAKLANQQLEEEENKMYYLEHQEQLEHEYQMLLAMNETRRANYKNLASKQVLETLVKTWSTGGASEIYDNDNASATNNSSHGRRWWPFGRPKDEQLTELERIAKEHRDAERAKQREEKRQQRLREKALKEAAKVVVDYRPVMSRIIDDYLFRCPSWHYAHIVSRNRVRRGNKNNVFVYRFSQPTHIPGFKECWGKSCHTAELPYVFQAMDVIRSNYSTLGPFAQKEAPTAPEYPYTDLLEAYRGALEAVEQEFDVEDPDAVLDLSGGKKESSESHFKNMSHTKAFQRLLISFFGDYFAEDADEEIATDMAERWSSFARTGDPNYDGSKVEWLPWRYIPSEDDVDDEEWNARLDNSGGQATTSSQEDYWNDIEFLSDAEDNEESENATTHGFLWSNVKEERAYRRRALRALGMEVVDEDSLRTELRRVPRSHEGDLDRAFLMSKFLFRPSLGGKDGSHARIPKRVIRQVQRIAQDMGVLGVGLQGEDPRLTDWDDDFFPEILELKWPPEGRLVERDCTCDMWDRIRYRY